MGRQADRFKAERRQVGGKYEADRGEAKGKGQTVGREATDGVVKIQAASLQTAWQTYRRQVDRMKFL